MNDVMRSILFTALLLFCAYHSPAADTLRVLFTVNSYTGANDLPKVTSDTAAAGATG